MMVKKPTDTAASVLLHKGNHKDFVSEFSALYVQEDNPI
jgi:hypothetical protein